MFYLDDDWSLSDRFEGITWLIRDMQHGVIIWARVVTNTYQHIYVPNLADTTGTYHCWHTYLPLLMHIPTIVDACIYPCWCTYLPLLMYLCWRTYLPKYTNFSVCYQCTYLQYHCRCMYLPKSVIYAIDFCAWKTIRNSCQLTQAHPKKWMFYRMTVLLEYLFMSHCIHVIGFDFITQCFIQILLYCCKNFLWWVFQLQTDSHFTAQSGLPGTHEDLYSWKLFT